MAFLKHKANFLHHVTLLLLGYVCHISAFNLYPFVDSKALAKALNISVGCVVALNDTVDCDNDLFQWTVTVDDHWWETDNLTTLCTSGCTASAQAWNTDVASACTNDDLVVQGSLVPAATVAGRFWDGLQIACLQSSSSDWCLYESQSWVGSDVVRPDCAVVVDDPSCSDPANVTAENGRLANLYSDELLCSDCFIKLFDLRLASDYLPDSDYSDYLVAQLQDIQDVCSTSVGAISTRAFGGFAPAFPTVVSNATTTTDITTGSSVLTSTATTSTTSSVAIATPTPIQTGMISSCDEFYLVGAGDDCFDIANNYSITLEDFYTWNKDVTDNCTAGLWSGYYYCVGIGLDPGLLTSSDCQTVDFSYGVSTKDPVQACQQMSQLWNVTTGDLKFYTGGSVDCYSEETICMPAPCKLVQVGTGATCASMAASLSTTAMNVTAQMFLSWNPHILGGCDNLTVNQSVCASAPGGSYQPPANVPPDVSGGGQERGGPGGSDPTAITGTTVSIIVTVAPADPSAAPQPTQAASIDPDCNQYDQAEDGDICTGFAQRNGIAPADLYRWNSILGTDGADCQTELWVGYYYCIGVKDDDDTMTTSPTTTTRSTSSSIMTSSTAAIPSPTQPGSIVSTCNKYAEAVAGTYCSLFASDNGITTAQLYTWNSVLGANGENCGTAFFAGYYYCVGVE